MILPLLEGLIDWRQVARMALDELRAAKNLTGWRSDGHPPIHSPPRALQTPTTTLIAP
jgi:hypothetical protein